jgi:hypothetical protein
LLINLKVERALSQWSTGELVVPTKNEAQFSEANWGDTTTRYLPTIERVTSSKYRKIIQGAKDFSRQRKLLASRSRTAAPSPEVEDDDRGMLDVSSDVEPDDEPGDEPSDEPDDEPDDELDYE